MSAGTTNRRSDDMKTTVFRPGAVACAVALALASLVAMPKAADAREVKAQARGNVNASANRSSASRDVNRSSASRDVNRSNVNVNRSNVNVNRSNVNVNRNTRVDVDRHVDIDVDVDHGWDNDWDDHHHPVATAAAVGTAVAVTSAVVGSIVRSLPSNCQTVVVNGVSYSQCGSTWYQPQYAGTTVQYVVVNPPR